MLTLKDFGSVKPTFAADVPSQKSPRFSFVNIQKPGEVRDKKKQSTIRRHAKKDSDREKFRRRRAEVELLTSESSPEHDAIIISPAKQPSACHRAYQKASDTLILDGKQTDNRRGFSVDSLDLDAGPPAIWKPLGAGRGYTPFAPYPVQATHRTTQLLDHRMKLT
jgi:hypothetical protein